MRPITIMVASGKGGVGKTTTTVRLANSLSDNFKVLIIDMDWGLSNVLLHYTVESRSIITTDFHSEGSLINKCVKLNKEKTRYLLQAPPTYNQSMIKLDWVNKTLEEALVEGFQYVILDVPANIEEGFHVCSSVVDYPIFVTNLELTAIRDCSNAVSRYNQISSMGHTYKGTEYKNQNTVMSPYVILNNVTENQVIDPLRNRKIVTGLTTNVFEIEEALNMTVLGIVPYDRKVIGTINHGKGNNTKKHVSSKAIHRIVDRILQVSKTKEPYIMPTVGEMLDMVFPAIKIELSLWGKAIKKIKTAFA